MQVLDVAPVVFPEPTPALFGTMMTATLLVVVGSLANAVYVGYIFHTSEVRSLWPMYLLRFVVAVVITAGMVWLVGEGGWLVGG